MTAWGVEVASGWLAGALSPGGDDRRADDGPGLVVQSCQCIVEIGLAGSLVLDLIAQPFDAQPGDQPGVAAWLVAAVRAAGHPAKPGLLQAGHQVPAADRVPACGLRRPLPGPGDCREGLLRRLGVEQQAIGVLQDEPAASTQGRCQF